MSCKHGRDICNECGLFPALETGFKVKTTIEFNYAIGDHVHIRDYPDIRGRVVGLCQRIWGNTYCVCWWQDGKRFEEWLHDWEIDNEAN